MFWSVETKFKDQYENEPLVVVPMPSVTDDDSELIFLNRSCYMNI